MLLDVRDQCTSPKETAMNHNDKKENQNPPIKDPSIKDPAIKDPSSNPSNPTSKPGMKDDDNKTGSDKQNLKADDQKASGDKSSTGTSGNNKR